MASQLNTSGATLPATISPLPLQAQPMISSYSHRKQLSSCLDSDISIPAPNPPTTPSCPASHTSPHSAIVPTTIARAFQPPATYTISSLQAALATRAAAPTQPGPSNIYLTQLSGTIPTAEFVDFNELLHAIEVGRSQHCVYWWEKASLVPRPHPKNRERGLVSIAKHFCMCRVSILRNSS